MSRPLYKQFLQKAAADPVVRSGMKLASKLNMFQTIADKPMAPRALATSLHMKERYIRELSQAMLATGVIDMNVQGELNIPPEFFKDLLAVTDKAEWEPNLLKTLPILEECFRKDGKAGYNPDEAAFVLEVVNKSRSRFIPRLVAALIQNMQEYHPGAIKHVLDVGCGTGDITIPLAKGLDGVSVIGCDTSEKAIITASKSSEGVKNVSFVKVDGGAYNVAWRKKFDVVLLFDVLHDLPYPDKTMTYILEVLKDDGIIVILDPDVSNGPMKNVGNIQAAHALTFSSFYCVPTSCCHHDSSALGVSWGSEQKEHFLIDMGLEVKHRTSLLDSLFNHTFVCAKR